MADLIRADGTVTKIQHVGRKFTLEEVQQLVGGYVQVIRMDDNKLLLCDEDGKSKDKPYNTTATRMARYQYHIKASDFIVGDVLLCNKTEF
jgi:hypothetical protein